MRRHKTLYLPVFVKGALIWTGDSHCLQGNGEVNLEALECAYKEFEIQPIVRKDMKMEWPQAETKDYWIFTGFDEDLTEAMKIATRNTIDWLSNQRMVPMNRYEAYALAPSAPIAESLRWWTFGRVCTAWCPNPSLSNRRRQRLLADSKKRGNDVETSPEHPQTSSHRAP